MTNKKTIIQGDNLEILQTFPDGEFQLIYADPPFNTGTTQKRKRSKKGNTLEEQSKLSFVDKFDNFIPWLRLRVKEIHRVLAADGSFFLHMDYREIHYAKVMCDEIFGRHNMINELVWSYDFGARAKKKWSAKHDTILWYVKDLKKYTYNYDKVDRVPYKAPELVRRTAKNAEEKIARGKTITDVWNDNIVHTMSKERTGYPTQKPLTILERIVKVHSSPGDKLLDPFAGSGSFGDAALKHDRNIVLIDENPEAIEIIEKRLAKYG